MDHVNITWKGSARASTVSSQISTALFVFEKSCMYIYTDGETGTMAKIRDIIVYRSENDIYK